MDARGQPTCLYVEHQAERNSRFNDCESASTKLASVSLKLERRLCVYVWGGPKPAETK